MRRGVKWRKTLIKQPSVRSRATAVSHASDINMNAVKNLAPQALWKQFAALSSIPRPSKGEQEGLGLSCRRSKGSRSKQGD